MRFIIHEMTYERPIAGGQLRYEREGTPTGAVEKWRLTEAVDGYRVLRVDLDAREAPSRRSTLYHAVLNPAGRPEQIKYQLWADGVKVSGVVVCDDDGLLAVREAGSDAVEETADAAAFWFPSTLGLWLLRVQPRGQTMPGVTLDADADRPEQLMALRPTTVRLEGPDRSGELEITWDGGRRWLMLDENGYPAKMRRDDGLTAVETRLMAYSH